MRGYNKRKVVIIYGEWGRNTDFVIEPVCKECEVDGKECNLCKNYIYIQKVGK